MAPRLIATPASTLPLADKLAAIDDTTDYAEQGTAVGQKQTDGSDSFRILHGDSGGREATSARFEKGACRLITRNGNDRTEKMESLAKEASPEREGAL